MKLLGNYRNWINPEWIDFLENNRGMGKPKEGLKYETCDLPSKFSVVKDHSSVGYDPDSITFWMFDKSNFPFDINPPWISDFEEKINNRKTGSPYHWWITKLMPSNFMPMHVDPHHAFMKTSIRHWVPLTDWNSGHLFLCDDFVPLNYSAGDVYSYNADALHGAVNIGTTNRYVLHIATHDDQ